MISKILISEYEKDENKSAMDVIFALLTKSSGEDYFSSLASSLASVYDIESVYIAGFQQDKDLLKTFAFIQQGEIQPEFTHNSSRTPFSLVLRTFKYFYTERLLSDFPEFETIFPGENSVFLGFPLIGALGDIVGMVCFVDHKPIEKLDSLLKLLDLLSTQITQELERQQAEDFLLLTAKAIDILSTNIKEIHRLSISNYESIEDLFAGYLKSGAQLFQLPLGIISQINEGLFATLAVEDSENVLSSGQVFRIEDTYCSLVVNSGKTVFFNNALEIKDVHDTEFFKRHRYLKYIGAPIFLNGKIAGTLSFYSFDSDSSLIEEHLIEVIELMSKSISSELEKREAVEAVKKIKLQQDGDYYLTSLLIKPLAQHRVESNQFSVEFLLKQKKQFQFKTQMTEIGGDICIAHSVQLRGKQHLVFLNADAMGKSIQGAGGALVVGSVFGSIIERTKIVESYKNFYPEQWLSAVFHELQKIFESFDYSMLVSMLLGIVEDEVGLLYYINAEHPSLVVYRDNTAEFIENKYHYFKLGTTPQNKLAINTFQLKPGDVIIAGSDGRDDIYLPPDETGNKELNYDEKLFLKHVKNGKGTLDGIYKSIVENGELSDDLSLIRLEYVVPKKYYKNRYKYELAQIMLKYKQEVQSGANYMLAMAYLHVAFILNDSSPIVIKELMRLHLRHKNYTNAISYGERYLLLDPDSNETLFTVSYAYKKSKNYEKAISFSERLRLREPELNRNLFHLIILYLKTGNNDKALEVYDELLELGRYDLKLKRIHKLLNRSL